MYNIKNLIGAPTRTFLFLFYFFPVFFSQKSASFM
nr:MAG TPA: hypothetical protein [Caudoviricetes sp.]